jgi:hypothetical protein
MMVILVHHLDIYDTEEGGSEETRARNNFVCSYLLWGHYLDGGDTDSGNNSSSRLS